MFKTENTEKEGGGEGKVTGRMIHYCYYIHKSISQLLFSGLICSRIVLLVPTPKTARCSTRSSSLIDENVFSRDCLRNLLLRSPFAIHADNH